MLESPTNVGKRRRSRCKNWLQIYKETYLAMDILLEGRKGNPAALWIRSRTNSRTKTSCQTEACGTRRERVRLERERRRGRDPRGEEEMKRSERGEGMGWLKQAWCLIQRNWRHAPLTTQQATPSTSRKTGPEEGREEKKKKEREKEERKLRKKKKRKRKERKEERRRDPLCPP